MMTTIVLVGVASSLVVYAIILKSCARKPKKPEKWEKADIMKQLLTLSDHEEKVNGVSRKQFVSKPATRRRRTAAASASPSRRVRPA